MRRGTFVFIALAIGWISLSPRATAGPAARGALPRLMLWAWERPSDLRRLPAGAGVAFLSQTLTLRDGAMVIEPRRNPLRVAPGTPLVAVTRIETGGHGAALPRQPLIATATAIAQTASLPGVSGLQIDFDAAASERAMYRALLHAVRRALDAGVPLSMTALASWCAGDRWLDGLPVDEAVPMLFRMGPVHESYASMAGSASAAPHCRGALGTALDEPLPIRAGGRRVYVFNAAPWTPAAIARASEVLE